MPQDGETALVLCCSKKEKKEAEHGDIVCETHVGFGAEVLRHISNLLHNPTTSHILGFL